jgi:hypothetical protein
MVGSGTFKPHSPVRTALIAFFASAAFAIAFIWLAIS